MKPKSRIDIIIGKLKPTADKPTMPMMRGKDKMQSSDFVQEIDMDEESMMHETCGEAIMQAIKQHDAKALAEAIVHLIEMHENSSEEAGAGNHFGESEESAGGESDYSEEE